MFLQCTARIFHTNIYFEINFDKDALMVINTNVKHSLSDSAYNARRSVCEKISEILNIKALRDATEEDLSTIKNKVSEENYQKALFVIQENKRAEAASKAMIEGDLKKLGELIYESHNGLQHQYKVSCDELDYLVGQAKNNPNILKIEDSVKGFIFEIFFVLEVGFVHEIGFVIEIGSIFEIGLVFETGFIYDIYFNFEIVLVLES